jgi:hypothetical protein
LPLWHQHLGVAVQVLAVPAIALVALGGLYRAAVDRSGKAMWLDYALLVGAALAVAIMVERASATAAAIAAPAAALQIRKWLDRAQTLSLKPMQVLAMLGALLLLVPSMPVLLAVKVARPEQGVKESAVRAALKCQDPANLYALDRLPAADILSPLDTGPSLIYATHHRIVASGHHRGNGGMRDIIEAFMASPDKARAIARRRGIEYVAFCPGLSEPDLYIKESSDGLMAQLSAGKQVSWLEPVQVPGVRSLKIYRVEP